MESKVHPLQNHLLAALPADVREDLTTDLDTVSLGLGEVLYEADTVMRNVYFPIDAIVSLLYVMADAVPPKFR